jgi:naphthalene 1,2-dioxygenase ferredoxin component
MSAPAWTPVASLDDFAASDAIAVEAGGRQVAIYLVDGSVFATSNRCTHGDASLCDGFLEGHEIECPHHQGRFDVRTGVATAAPAEVALATWPARIVDGRVELQLD